MGSWPPVCATRCRSSFAVALLLALSALLVSWAPWTAAADATAPVTIEAFVREGCPHCAEAEEFLARLGAERPDLSIRVRDVMREPAAMARLQALVREAGGAPRVPAIYVGGQLITGYSHEAGTDRLVRAALAGRRAAGPVTAGEAGSCEADDQALACGRPGATDSAEAGGAQLSAAPPAPFAIRFFGRTLTLDDVGLPAFTLAMGLLDGFNPCSMWVLLLMISILAPLNDRPRMLAIAGTFVLVQGAAYFLFMAAWLNFFLLIGASRASQLAIAAIAIVAGLINMKDYFAFGRGVSLSIPEKARPGIYQRMRALLHERRILAAVAGAFVLAVLVQVVEFMCTSGFPALFTRILTLRQLDTAGYYTYMLMYIGAYLLDDVIVLGTGVALLSRHRLQEREGRVLKLVSGLVMVGLGLYLIADG